MRLESILLGALVAGATAAIIESCKTPEPPPDCRPRVEYGGRGFVVVTKGRAVRERSYGR